MLKMTRDNIGEIKKYLKWTSDDDFYYVEITQRKKDNPELLRNSNIINSYRITSMNHLDSLIEEMKLLAKHYNARVGINLNRRSFKKLAWNTSDIIQGHLKQETYTYVERSLQKASEGHCCNGERYWILDMDDSTEIDLDLMMYIDELEPYPYRRKALGVNHTKSGYHLICKPFRVDSFRDKYPDVDIKKDNLTILYIP